MMRLVLLRHGRTEANDRWLYCGKTDLPLSDAGRSALAEARAAGGYPDAGAFRCYTSGMKRTEETLSVLYGEREHGIIWDMREMDFGAFEMRGYEQLREVPEYRSWCSGDNEANLTPGGESGKQMQHRVIRALNVLIERNEDALIVSHGGPIAAMMAYLFPNEGKNRFEWQPKNGEGYLITIDGDERTVRAIPKGGEYDGG